MTPLTARLLFFAKFVVAAAGFFALWRLGGAWAYGYAVLVAVTVLSPILTGYDVAIGNGAHGITAFFQAGTARIEVPFILHEALAGLIPFLALMTASGGQTIRQWAQRTAIGVGIIYVAHVAVLIFSPLLVTDHARWISRTIDVVFGFYAVAGFVGLPFSLWMILTRPWEVTRTPEVAVQPAAKAPTPAAAARQGSVGKRKR